MVFGRIEGPSSDRWRTGASLCVQSGDVSHSERRSVSSRLACRAWENATAIHLGEAGDEGIRAGCY